MRFNKGNPKYNEYLETHIKNVYNGYKWLKNNIPESIEISSDDEYYGDMDDIILSHDNSKYGVGEFETDYYSLGDEYHPYADYFYGEQTDEVKRKFDYAWLHHIHNNPHHWQYWMLQNDDDGFKLLDMPKVFIVEMICDWWSFSWTKGNLFEIFSWYDEHKSKILISDNTRKIVENILDNIKEELEKGDNE